MNKILIDLKNNFNDYINNKISKENFENILLENKDNIIQKIMCDNFNTEDTLNLLNFPLKKIEISNEIKTK